MPQQSTPTPTKTHKTKKPNSCMVSSYPLKWLSQTQTSVSAPTRGLR
jgi:hypothetical protein